MGGITDPIPILYQQLFTAQHCSLNNTTGGSPGMGECVPAPDTRAGRRETLHARPPILRVSVGISEKTCRMVFRHDIREEVVGCCRVGREEEGISPSLFVQYKQVNILSTTGHLAVATMSYHINIGIQLESPEEIVAETSASDTQKRESVHLKAEGDTFFSRKLYRGICQVLGRNPAR
jgi:hypothetical protein